MDLLDDLIDTTDKFITNVPARVARSGVQETMERVRAVPLAWSAALRVSHETIIKATIAYVVIFLSSFYSNRILFLELEEAVSYQINVFRSILTLPRSCQDIGVPYRIVPTSTVKHSKTVWILSTSILLRSGI